MLAESLKDLVRFLRRDDTTCEIRRQLGYSEVLQNVCSIFNGIYKNNHGNLINSCMRRMTAGPTNADRYHECGKLNI